MENSGTMEKTRHKQWKDRRVALIKIGIRSTYQCACNLMLYYGKEAR